MGQVPYQTFVSPYRRNAGGEIELAIFSRAEYPCWQGTTAIGEDEQAPLEAAWRECLEEACVPGHWLSIGLETIKLIPVSHFQASEPRGKEVFVISGNKFGVEIGDHQIQISLEYREYRWLAHADALKIDLRTVKHDPLGI